MKKFLVLFFSIFICSIAHADTETINWYVDGNSYATTTCQTGGDIILSNTPYKYGYTFQGWSAYTPIEYLEFKGMQYIDLNYKFNGTISVVEANIYMPDNIGLTNSSYTLIATQNNSSARWGSIQFYGGYLQSGVGNTPASNNLIPVINNFKTYIKATTDVNQKTLSITYNNISANVSFSGDVYTDQNATIGCKNMNNQKSEYFIGKVYDFKLSVDNVLIYNLIPVLDKNNVPCMYDKVTKQFFYNQGTGNFIAGPVINQ